MKKHLRLLLIFICFIASNAFAADESKYDDYIAQASSTYGVDASLIKAVIKQESAFRDDVGNGDVLSSAGAVGAMQLLPSTGADMGFSLDELKTPETNIMAGTKYLKYLIDNSNIPNNVPDILAAYNAGPGNYQQYNGIPPFDETINYVKNASQYYANYAGIPPLDLSSLPAPTQSGGSQNGTIPTASVTPQISADMSAVLSSFSTYMGMDYTDIRSTIQAFLVFFTMMFGAYQIFRFFIGMVGQDGKQVPVLESALYSSRTILIMLVLFSFITFNL